MSSSSPEDKTTSQRNLEADLLSSKTTTDGVSNSAEVSDDDPVAVMKSLETESDDLWKFHRITAITTLTLPAWLSLGILAAGFLWGGLTTVRKLIVATMASAAAGRFVILGGKAVDHPGGFTSLELALLVLYLDTIWAIVLTWHAGFLFHVPWIGQRLKAAVREGTLMLKQNRWMRSITVVAVLTFVMLPVSSTGSIGGSILGRLLGLSRMATLTVVLFGSILGGATMLLGAEALRPWFSNHHPAVQYGGIVVIVLILFILSRRYRRSIAD